jgi:hypothetical protein
MIKVRHIAERYFELEECLNCKSEKFKAIVTLPTIYYKDGDEYWTDKNIDYEDVKVFCSKCNLRVEE